MKKNIDITNTMTIKENQNWQRVESVIEWANMSTNYFAKYIGLPRGENLYQIKKGNNGISRDLAAKIIARFPAISKLWLLTGEGEMFASSEHQPAVLDASQKEQTTKQRKGVGVPFYSVGLASGIRNLSEIRPDYNMIVPYIGEYDFAIRESATITRQDAVTSPILFLKGVEPNQMELGKEYVVVDEDSVRIERIFSSNALAEGVQKVYRIVAKLTMA